MAFIRAKKTKTGTAYYLVESYRDAGKIRQRVLLYLGTGEEFSTLEKAEATCQIWLDNLLYHKERLQEHLDKRRENALSLKLVNDWIVSHSLFLGPGKDIEILPEGDLIPRNRQLRNSGDWVRGVLSMYWYLADEMEKLNRQISKVEQRLEKIREYLAQQ